MVSYTIEGSGDTKAIQNLLGLEGNIISAEESKENTASDETGSDSLIYHLHNKDIQGSTTSILDESGVGELSYEYDDFGETEVNGSGTFENEICYTGGIYDATTGLYYLNARYYDPENGRFLTEDTYRGEVKEPDTLHLYVYCKNNPINYVDPSGHVVITLTATTIVAGVLIVYTYYYYVRWVWGRKTYVFRNKKVVRRKPLTIKPKASKVQAKTAGNKVSTSIKKTISYSKSKVKSGTKSKKESKKSQKERATEIPSWADGSRPIGNESGKEYAKRKMDEHYGKNKWKRKGKQAEEYSKLKKWGDRG